MARKPKPVSKPAAHDIREELGRLAAQLGVTELTLCTCMAEATQANVAARTRRKPPPYPALEKLIDQTKPLAKAVRDYNATHKATASKAAGTQQPAFA